MNNKLNIKSVLGKLMTVIVVIIATQYNVTAGVIALLVMIVFNHTVVEGMENKEDNSAKQVEESKHSDSVNGDSADDDKSDGVDDISKFRNDYCIDGKLTLDGKVVTMGTLKDSFPDLKFTGDACDPCDKDCQFEIISSSERLTAEENMRATDSNTQPVDHKEAIKKRE
jgi:hypothetical protein